MVEFDQTQPLRPEPEVVRFHGSGSEYFQIWIVNLLLSILTLGIYSAWAKVRRLQYFYRCTELAGASFEYHGKPLTILKGRIVGLLLLLLYRFGFKISTAVGVLSLLLLAALLPILLRNSLRFRLYNSSYRGLRFRFTGSAAGAYGVFLGGAVGSVLSLYLLLPLFHKLLKEYQHDNSWYGRTRFNFNASVGQFYSIYGRGVLMFLGLLVLLLLLAGGAAFMFHGLMPPRVAGAKPDLHAMLAMLPFLMFLTFVVYLPVVFFLAAYFGARLQSLIWTHTRLGEHRFEYCLSARRLLWIYVSNFVGVVLSLGFYSPWAMVRLARYRAESMTLIPATPLAGIVADEQEQVGAIGEETASVFDIDISF